MIKEVVGRMVSMLVARAGVYSIHFKAPRDLLQPPMCQLIYQLINPYWLPCSCRPEVETNID